MLESAHDQLLEAWSNPELKVKLLTFELEQGFIVLVWEKRTVGGPGLENRVVALGGIPEEPADPGIGMKPGWFHRSVQRSGHDGRVTPRHQRGEGAGFPSSEGSESTHRAALAHAAGATKEAGITPVETPATRCSTAPSCAARARTDGYHSDEGEFEVIRHARHSAQR